MPEIALPVDGLPAPASSPKGVGSPSPVQYSPHNRLVTFSQRARTRDRKRISELEVRRSEEVPSLPELLAGTVASAFVEDGLGSGPECDEEVANTLKSIAGLPVLSLKKSEAGTSVAEETQKPPMSVGVVSVSSHPAAAGSMNVILGLLEFVSSASKDGSGKLWGIQNLTRGDEYEIGPESRSFLNQAGCDVLPTLPLAKVTNRMLSQFEDHAKRLSLKGLVFLAGVGELPQVARIADHFCKNKVATAVVAVVQGVSGWAQVPPAMPSAVGFDSACGSLAEIAGNVQLAMQSLERDIYHFVCCGSPPLTLETAMLTHPTLCFIGEDVSQRHLTLQAIIDEICDVIIARHHEHGLCSGVILVSDDLFEALVEMRRLRDELHRLRLEKPAEMRSEESAKQLLEPELSAFFSLLPASVTSALVFRTDVDGLPMLKLQEAEAELGALVARRLADRASWGQRSVPTFAPQPHNLRHLAFCPMPTPLDCALGYALGHAAGALARDGHNGYAAGVGELDQPCAGWSVCGVPLTRLLEIGPAPEKKLMARRRSFAAEDKLLSLWRKVQARWRYRQSYRQPGPVQYWWKARDAGAPARAHGIWQAEGFGEDVEMVETVAVPLKPPRRLFRRSAALLSPLQKWRMAYEPRLPSVLRGPYWLSEAAKGSVCADRELAHKAFPSLMRTDNLKAVQVESITEEVVSVLDKLPDKATGLRSNASAVSLRATASIGNFQDFQWDSDTADPGSPSFASQLQEGFGSKRTGLRIGFVLMGRSGPGVNNVVMGLFDFLKPLHGTVVCIAMGIAGLVEGHSFELDEEMLQPFRNQGGSDLLGLSEPDDFKNRDMGHTCEACADSCRRLKLDGIVVWGGRNIHSWTPRLAEYFVEKGVPTSVIGVPASVQSDLPLIEQSLGYDTMCKLLASVVGNLATQAASSGRQWYFIRIQGRSISHIAAEVALQTHPHVVLVQEDEHDEAGAGLSEVVRMICDVIESRSREDKNYGVVLVPDQFLASVREMRQLFQEMSQIHDTCPEVLEGAGSCEGLWNEAMALDLLSPFSRALVKSLPERLRAQLCLLKFEDSDMSDRLNLSSVDTEVIFQALVETELTRRVVLGSYKGPFQSVTYSMVYHGRAAMPTNFDCDLGYTTGFAAGIFVESGRTGLLVEVKKLKEHPDDWEVWGTPLPSLLSFKDSCGQDATSSSNLASFSIQPRRRLRYDQHEQDMPAPVDRTLINPGPSQFAGPCADEKTQSLCKPQLQRVRQQMRTDQLVTELQAKARAGCQPEVLRAVRMLLQGGVQLLKEV